MEVRGVDCSEVAAALRLLRFCRRRHTTLSWSASAMGMT